MKPTTKRPPGRPRVEVKPQQFSIRLHKAERSALEAMADLYGTSISGAAERCIRDAWEAMTPAQRRAISSIKKAREAASE